jgi:hypothetical protein
MDGSHAHGLENGRNAALHQQAYLEPATFMYYLPSIIIGVSREMEFWDFALEAIIPYNKNRVPRGRWWSQ